MSLSSAITELCRKGARLRFDILREKNQRWILVGFISEFWQPSNHILIEEGDANAISAIEQAAAASPKLAWCDVSIGYPRDWTWAWVTDGRNVWPALRDSQYTNGWTSEGLTERYDNVVAWRPMRAPAPPPAMCVADHFAANIPSD